MVEVLEGKDNLGCIESGVWFTAGGEEMKRNKREKEEGWLKKTS